MNIVQVRIVHRVGPTLGSSATVCSIINDRVNEHQSMRREWINRAGYARGVQRKQVNEEPIHNDQRLLRRKQLASFCAEYHQLTEDISIKSRWKTCVWYVRVLAWYEAWKIWTAVQHTSARMRCTTWIGNSALMGIRWNPYLLAWGLT